MMVMVLLLTGCKIQSVDEYQREGKEELVEVEGDKNKEDLKSSAKDDDKEDKGDKKAEEKEKTKDEKEDSSKESPKKAEESKDNSSQASKNENSSQAKNNSSKNNTSSGDKGAPSQKSNQGSKAQPKAQPKAESKPQAPQPKPQAKPQPKPQPKPQAKPEPAKEYVSIQIRVDSINKGNIDKLDPNLKGYVPSNGSVLGSTKYILNDGETVFDILVRATRDKNIHMSYQGSGSSAYIQGINNLYEFSCGESSGWMYTVNGSRPNKSVGAYKLKDGDSISFDYTCNLGKDL